MVPCSRAEDLAGEIAELWPVEELGTALDLAVVEGLATPDATRFLWGLGGYEFPGLLDTEDWLGATFCSFWWD
jgi:hypothetical protein